MDMRQYNSGETFLKPDDVRAGPIRTEIAVVKDGKFDKPNIIFENGDALSLNATNRKTLMRAYGCDGDLWIGKIVELFLGSIKYQGAEHDAVLVRPISPPDDDHKAVEAAGSNKLNLDHSAWPENIRKNSKDTSHGFSITSSASEEQTEPGNSKHPAFDDDIPL